MTKELLERAVEFYDGKVFSAMEIFLEHLKKFTDIVQKENGQLKIMIKDELPDRYRCGIIDQGEGKKYVLDFVPETVRLDLYQNAYLIHSRLVELK